MPLTAPNLDDRTFADLLAEAQRLIPRYAPEWTDHNESDPGITLLQLYAWFVEVAIFRLNRVPERNYVKFLELLGMELMPARPARTELTFTLARDDVDSVVVPKATQVGVADPEGGAPILFETDRALVALGAKLAAVQVYDGFAYALQTTKNDAEDQWLYPFGPLAKKGSALCLGFDSDLSFTSEQVDLAVRVFTEGLIPEGRHCDLDLEVVPVAAEIVWEFWSGGGWDEIILDQDETRAFTRDGHVRFPGPGADAKKLALGKVEDELYWIRARLDRAGYDEEPRLTRVAINTVPATQAVTVEGEVLGGSNGRPDQAFKLTSTPVVDLDRPFTVTNPDGERVTVERLQLEVDEGDGPVVWQQVDDFLASGEDDTHYVLNTNTGEIRFGDGDHGRIPVPNATNPAGNVIARFYRVGGGRSGNVGSDAITELQDSVDGIDSVTNPLPATGGSDEETVDEAKKRASGFIKSRERAVTSEDFEYLARETPGVRVRRAKALPLTHPSYEGAPIPGVVTVVVVPDSDASAPTPGEATLRTVCQHLNKHRLLTTEVHVVPPTYREVKIEARVVVRPEADLAEVRAAVEKNLVDYFHPLTGGSEGLGWEFGRSVMFSDVFRVVVTTEGVDRVHENQLVIWLDDEAQPACRDVPIGKGELVFSEGHSIRVAYGF